MEITDSAFPVNEHPFKRSTAFLLGNEVIIEFMIVGLFLFFVSMEKLLAFYGNGWCGSGFLNRAWLQGTGLSTKECEICDFFVYIPQYGCGTASLNVTVAASIVLHHFGGMHDIDACTWIVF